MQLATQHMRRNIFNIHEETRIHAWARHCKGLTVPLVQTGGLRWTHTTELPISWHEETVHSKTWQSHDYEGSITSVHKRTYGSLYLIADVGKEDGLKGLGAHSKRVPSIRLPDQYIQSSGLNLQAGRGLLQRRATDCRSKMRPDLVMIEMTTAEQRTYLSHNNVSGLDLQAAPSHMPNGSARRIWIVEADTAQTPDTQTSFRRKKPSTKPYKLHCKDMATTLPIILGVSGSQYHITTDGLQQIGIEHTQADSLMLKLHEHAVTALHNIVILRRVLKRGPQHGRRTQNRNRPLRGHWLSFYYVPDIILGCLGYLGHRAASGCIWRLPL